MLFSCAKEAFENLISPRENFGADNTSAKYVALLLAILLWLAVLLAVSQYLWNQVLCKVVTFAKPVDSILQILGLVILFEIISPK